MPRKCFVAGCTANATLFSPRDNNQKVKWQEYINYTGGINSISNFRVCADHFTDAQFEDPDHLLLRLAPRRRKCFLKPETCPLRGAWLPLSRQRHPHTHKIR